MDRRPKLALIAGPTASGKSALALAIAERHDGVIVNADASQVYADLRVLTARPALADEARVPHCLFGYIDGVESCSAARWAGDARAAIAAVHAAGRLPIVVGGSGLYLRTLLDGIAPVPPIDPAVRSQVRALPVAQAYDALERIDAAAAARLSPADTTRVARALEVVRSTGRTLAQWQAHRHGGIGAAVALRPIVVLPPRDWLAERCAVRAGAMLAQGAVGEVRALAARGLPPAAPVMRAIGVAEIVDMLAERSTAADTLASLQRATLRYAKRQYTWFRNQPPMSWHRSNATEIAKLSSEFEIILRY